MAGKYCDVCGKDDLPTGVRSSALGPMSFAFCDICLVMGAEPNYWVEALIECCDGLKNVNTKMLLTYYDRETDSYIDKREGNIPIILKDGTEFKTRSEFINKMENK